MSAVGWWGAEPDCVADERQERVCGRTFQEASLEKGKK